MTDLTLAAKEADLRAVVRSYGPCIVAFSGGVDSALVLTIAAQELGERSLGITGVSPSLPGSEREDAARFARSVGARLELLDTHELDDPKYASNPANRCYYCKSELYGRLAREATRRGYETIADGLNADDLTEVRHGRRAANEHAVRSPLAEVNLAKNDVRALARKLGLAVWDKPAAACLSSRFPTGTAITLELLQRVERAEDVLAGAGLRECRVRHHGDIARIEVPIDAFERVLAMRDHVLDGVRAAGYRFVTLDLGGYVRGGVAAQPSSDAPIDLISLR